MTSSLVGSEMCIRDRGKRDHDSGVRVSAHQVDGWALKLLVGTVSFLCTCLLYTSDAADDM
eukprot:2455959-Prorocentrum_lima.AAC.1